MKRLAVALVAASLFTTAGAAERRSYSRDVVDELRRIAAAAPGTLGVRLVQVESGASAGINDEAWFPMMSVYKLPIAVHVLRAAERGTLDLAATVTLRDEDRRPGFSPLARTIETNGPQKATLRELLSAIVRVSDNTASDRLLREAGGPAAVAATLRQLNADGIDVSRYELQFAADYYGASALGSMRPFSLDRFAAAVEQVSASRRQKAAEAYVTDRRDSTQPRAFAAFMARLAKGELLTAADTAWLLGEMTEMHARDSRLRSGLPPGTLAGLRPGTSGETAGIRAAYNDTALVTLPDGRRLVIAAFLKRAAGTDAKRDATLASVARAAYQWAIGERERDLASSLQPLAAR